MHTKIFKVLDIFSGIGGMSIGLEKAGMKTVGFCEIEAFSTKILYKHWPDVPVFPDVRELNAATLINNNITNINVMAGGFPCQDISCAGKQVGIEGSRSGLWKEYKRLINELRPDYAIIENMGNLRSRGLITVLKDLWEIGYDAVWHCIPASAINAPHRRDRIWIIAFRTKTDVANTNYNGHIACEGYRNTYGNQPHTRREEKQEGFTKFEGGGTQPTLQRNVAHSAISGLERCMWQGKEGNRQGFAECATDISDPNHKGCQHYQGTATGSDGQERRQECTADSLACGNIVAGTGLPIHQTGFGKEGTEPGIHTSKTILANPDCTRQVGSNGANRDITEKSRCRRDNSAGSRGHDRRHHNPCPYETMERKRFEKASQVLTPEDIISFRETDGFVQWGIEPNIPRLTDGKLSADWVEWLMGFPISWTEGGTRKQRLIALGNAVVPQLPEIIGRAILNQTR